MKNNVKKKTVTSLSKKTVLASEYYYTCVNVLLQFSQANLLHGNAS